MNFNNSSRSSSGTGIDGDTHSDDTGSHPSGNTNDSNGSEPSGEDLNVANAADEGSSADEQTSQTDSFVTADHESSAPSVSQSTMASSPPLPRRPPVTPTRAAGRSSIYSESSSERKDDESTSTSMAEFVTDDHTSVVNSSTPEISLHSSRDTNDSSVQILSVRKSSGNEGNTSSAANTSSALQSNSADVTNITSPEVVIHRSRASKLRVNSDDVGDVIEENKEELSLREEKDAPDTPSSSPPTKKRRTL